MVVGLEGDDLGVLERGESVGGSSAVAVGVVNTVFPRRRKLAADAGSERVNGATDAGSNGTGEGDTAGLLFIGPLHHKAVMSQALGEFARHGAPGRFGALALVEGDAEVGAARSARSAGIVIVVAPWEGRFPPITDTTHRVAFCRLQVEASVTVVKLCRKTGKIQKLPRGEVRRLIILDREKGESCETRSEPSFAVFPSFAVSFLNNVREQKRFLLLMSLAVGWS